MAIYDVTDEDERAPRRLGARRHRALPQDRVRVSTLTGRSGLDLRPRRLRGRPALGELPRHAGRRRRGRRRPRRLRRRAARRGPAARSVC